MAHTLLPQVNIKLYYARIGLRFGNNHIDETGASQWKKNHSLLLKFCIARRHESDVDKNRRTKMEQFFYCQHANALNNQPRIYYQWNNVQSDEEIASFSIRHAERPSNENRRFM